jgi:tetratricopeptide (TPR) repeat protein
MFALLREVCSDDLRMAGRLVRNLHTHGVLDAGGDYGVLHLDTAALTVEQWLPAGRRAQLGSAAFSACRIQWPMLAAWDSADIALPLTDRTLAREGWFGDLLAEGLVSPGPLGYVINPRLRLLIWLEREAIATLPLPPKRALALWSSGLGALRRSGRWQDAARLADALLARLPGVGSRVPVWLIVALAGFVQMQDYPRARALATTSTCTRALADLPLRWRARLLALEAFVLAELGDLASARRLEAESKAVARGSGERIWGALAGAWCDILAGRYRRAERTLAFLEARLQARPDWLCSIITAWQAAANFYLERFDVSAVQYQEALQSARRAGWQDRLLAMLRNRAMNDIDLGELEKARPVLHGLRRRHEKHGYHQLLPGTWTEIGRLLARAERPELSAAADRRAVQLGSAAQTWLQVAQAHMGMGVAARATGNWDRAAEHFEETRAIAERVGATALTGSADFQLSRAAHHAGDTPRALRLLDSALVIFARTEQLSRLADAHRQAAEFLIEAGALDEAEQRLRQAEDLYSKRAWVREGSWTGLLRFELQLRRSPGTITERDVEAIDLGANLSRWQSTHAEGLLAAGFALLDDWKSARHYARRTVASALITQDLYLNRKLLNLAESLGGMAPAVDRLSEYWRAALRLPETGKGTA